MTLVLNSFSIGAQDKSNRGKEFWLGYGHNVLFTQDPPFNSQTLVLYLSAEEAANVTVSVNGTSWSQTVSIPANTVDFSITVPKTGAADARLLNEGLSTKGIHIISDVPIVAYAHQYGLLSSGATMLMPVETFGFTYYSLNYDQVSNYVDSYSWFYVVAAENNTRLEITPGDTTEGGWLPTQTYTVSLNKGEIYNVFGRRTGSLTSKDLTGSKIVSVSGSDAQCHPVAVFSGSSRITICAGNGGEFMQQQIFPANAWGTKYVTYHPIINTGGNITMPLLNYYRVAVRNSSTIVRVNGNPLPLASLVRNFYYEFSSNSGDIIESDQPILVAQYPLSTNECGGTNQNPTGDPEMIYLSPIEQGVKRTIFYNTRNQAITLNYVNIIVPVSGLQSMLIDGAPVSSSEYIIHPNSNKYAVVVKRLTGAAAQHSIICDSTFIASNYGAGIFESYAYNVGTLVNNLNAYGFIKNVNNTSASPDTITCAKTPIRVFIQLAYPASSITWKLTQVPGISATMDSVVNNPIPVSTTLINGRRYYNYTLQQDFSINTSGLYYLPVTYTAADIDNCNHTEQASIKIVVKNGPGVDFSMNNPACLLDTIRFNATITGADYGPMNYLWQFEDNTTATGLTAAKKFPIAGDQVISFTATAANGCTGDTVKTIRIHENPVAKFGTDGLHCSGNAIQFIDSSSISQGTINNWQWNFGNGTGTTTPPFSRTYSSGGVYPTSLTVKSNEGCISLSYNNPLIINATPVIDAGPDKIINPGASVKLDATINNPLQYDFNWSPAANLDNATILQPIATPTVTTSYAITTYDKTTHCESSDKVTVSVFTRLYVPAAFTPNGDGVNDTWEIPGLAMYPNAVLEVYNRSGQMVFQSKGLYSKGWNGKYRDMPQSNEVYVYMIRLKPDSEEIVKGTLTIIR